MPDNPAFPLTDKQAVFLQVRVLMLNAMLDRLEASNRELAALNITVAPVAAESLHKALDKTLTALYLSRGDPSDNFFSFAKKSGVLISRLKSALAVAA